MKQGKATCHVGDLEPIHAVVRWLDEQTKSIAAAPESVRIISVIRARLDEALADAENVNLTSAGLTVEQYAELHDLTPDAVYKRVQRGGLPFNRKGRGIRIPANVGQGE